MRHDTFFSQNARDQLKSPICPSLLQLPHLWGEQPPLAFRWQKRQLYLLICNTRGLNTRYPDRCPVVIKDRPPSYVMNPGPFHTRAREVALTFNPKGIKRFVEGPVLCQARTPQLSCRAGGGASSLILRFQENDLFLSCLPPKLE